MKIKNLKIEQATKNDISLILQFIKELAIYEKLLDKVTANEKILKKTLFGKNKFAEVILAYLNEIPVGFSIYFYNFSSFVGKPGIYIEDIYVKPEFRGKGIGKAIFKYFGELVKEKDCGRIEWSVLNWNKPSIDFYLKLGAIPMDEWTVFRLTGDKINQLDLL